MQLTNSPGSLYSVDPIVNIKGNLKNRIVVYQIEHPDRYPLLQINSSYIFAAWYEGQNDVYVIGVYPTTYSLLSDDPKLINREILTLAEKNNRMIALRKACTIEGCLRQANETLSPKAGEKFLLIIAALAILAAAATTAFVIRLALKRPKHEQ